MVFKKVFPRAVVLTVGLSFVFFSFVNISVSPTSSPVTLSGVRTASADCDAICEAFYRALGHWLSVFNRQTQNRNLDQTNNTQSPIQHFGGRVIASYPCWCNLRWVFVIDPIKGPTGPYVIDMLPNWALKKWYSVAPGNWVLGTALSEGYKQCLILELLCWPFEAEYWVPPSPLFSGMGTSLTP